MHHLYQRFVQPDHFRKPHPFDQTYHVDTTGFIPSDLLRSGLRNAVAGHPYAGCIPNVVRTAIGSIPDLPRFAFLDLGCGKGRALVVASEYPFRQIHGVELSAALAEVARRNAGAVRRQFPSRAAITVEAADATQAEFPAGPLAVYLYHPFPLDVFERVAQRLIEGALVARVPLYLIYENPVFFEVLDRDPRIERHFVASVACDPAEVGLNIDDSNVVSIWTLREEGRSLPERPFPTIRVAPSGWRAELADGAAPTG